MGLWAALTLQKAFRGRALVRGLVLFPYVVPVIAAAFVWKVMLNPQFGIVNVWIERLGGNPIDFLNTRDYDISVFGLFTITIPLALITVIIFEAWRYFPFAFLFILAALIAQPKDVEEAAIVDGATISQRFWYVTLPALRPVHLGAVLTALHLDVQQVRRCVPAHRRRSRNRSDHRQDLRMVDRHGPTSALPPPSASFSP